MTHPIHEFQSTIDQVVLVCEGRNQGDSLKHKVCNEQ